MQVLGRTPDQCDREGRAPTGRLGIYRARDGSGGAAVGIDLDRPHAGLVVGKRGSGKSYTIGVVAEAAARADGVAPVVIDPMGAFAGLADGAGARDEVVPAERVERPTVRASALPPSTWPDLLGLDAAAPVGALVWRAASERATLAGMRGYVSEASVGDGVRRAAENHLRLAESWDVFGGDGLGVDDLVGTEATVLDLTDAVPAAMNAVCAAVARGLYEARTAGKLDRLPWLFVDEAHAFFGGIAADALRTVLTRGRVPGVSLVAATQRPSALPDVAVSQADLAIVHRLTSGADIEALAAARPTYFAGSLRERLPRRPGDALVVDDATEAVHGVRIRERETPHGGASPRASDRRSPPSPEED
ncbi:ATP-binding protein [Halegenticoccus soli]|uniref:ATP-binding protein n=1 Tax=Halegenticoccus soli TaxID=1985678 RepID=UPI000C6CE6AF|nr:ATP-binding protein [Halegenticoccus soli]